jgi:oligopeptide/dipeptide ABC transporter ATP-binding protein
MSGGVVLLRAENIKTYFTVRGGFGEQARIRAVDGVTLDIRKNEVFGLVGESGSGKSTFGRSILGLNRLSGGRMLFEGSDISRWKDREMKAFRRKAQLIFQDPSGCLNPRRTLGAILMEGLHIHGIGEKSRRKEMVLRMMETVGLGEQYYSRYPYEVSGGQKQRVGIARALLLTPRLLICDEPVSALDVSIQAQVLNLLLDIRKRYSITYLFISHNLGVINYVSDRVGVMYYGRIVELADREELYEKPLHPYTKALISAIPRMNSGEAGERIILQGDGPDPSRLPRGCRFHPRCSHAQGRCRIEEPELRAYMPGHYAACTEL